MKKKNKQTKTILALMLLAIIMLMLVVVDRHYQQRSTKAQTYDLQCLSKPIGNPLKDCRK